MEVSWDDKLKEAQIEKIRAETKKIEAESKTVNGNLWSSAAAEFIKTAGTLAVAGISVLFAYTADKKKDNAEESRDKAKQTLIAEESQRVDTATALKELKVDHTKLTSILQKEAPELAPGRLVYVQFRGGMTRERVNDLREALKKSRFSAPGAERLAGTYRSEVRYFEDTDAGQARELADAVKLYLGDVGCPEEIVVVPTYPKGAKPLELWLESDCK